MIHFPLCWAARTTPKPHPTTSLYIDKVAGNNSLTVMEETQPEALNFFAGITEKSSLHRYAPDKWIYREDLNHITDTERAGAIRALWCERGFETASSSRLRTEHRREGCRG